MEIGSFDFQGRWKALADLPLTQRPRRAFHGPPFLGLFLCPTLLRAQAQFLKELCLGLLHATGRVGVADGSRDAFQGLDTESVAQVLRGFIQRQQGLQRGQIALVAGALAALRVDLHLELGAGPVVVQIRVELLAIEAVDQVGMAGIDVTVADMFADNRAVFGLHQAVVAALPGTGSWSVR